MGRLLTLLGFAMNGSLERGIGVWPVGRCRLAKDFMACISMVLARISLCCSITRFLPF